MKELIFMLKVMEKLGMPYSFINMIKLLFQDATFLVNIKNQAIGSFVLHKGVCQGSPLASYIFIIFAKAFNATIKNMARIGLVKGIILPQSNSQQFINQYVDDMSFIFRAEEANVDKMVAIFQSFGLASSLEIN